MTMRTDPLLRHIRRLVPRPAAPPSSDADLLRRFLDHKDEDAFAALVARHGPMVLGVCRRVLRNADAAEDAAQASFVVLARKAASIRRPETLAAWLHRTAHHLALAALRADSRRMERELRSYSPQTQADPLEEISVRELLGIVDEEVRRLPQRYRLPVILCCLEERTVEEAARQLNWSPGSVRGRLLRGRARLQKRLTRRGVTLSAALLVLGGVPALSTAGFATRLLAGNLTPRVLALAQEAMHSLTAVKLRRVLTLFLLLGMVGVGVGTLAHHGQARKPAEHTSEAQKTATARGDKPAARTDQFGDPLPEGAISRLGTLRWRHGGLTTAIQFAPDGKSLLTMGADGLRVWDVASGQTRHRLANREGLYLNPGILSVDGKQVVTVDLNRKENRLSLWDVASGKLLREFGDHPCIAGYISPDGKVLATLGTQQPGDPRFRDFNEVIALWDLTTGKQLHSWKGHKGGSYCGAFTADGKTLITGGADKVLRFWDVASGRQVRQLEGSSKAVGHITLSPDEKHLATIGLRDTTIAGGIFPSLLPWCADNDLALWDVAQGKIAQRFAIPAAKNFGSSTKFHMALFHPDGKTLLAVGWHPFAYRWDVATGKEVQRYDLHSGAAQSAALSPDGQTLATLCADSVRLFDVTTGRERSPTGGHHGPVWRTLLTPDGRTALTASMQEGDIAVWDAATGREQYRLPRALFANLLLAPSGRILYALEEERSGKEPSGGILVWDLATRKPLHRFPPHPVFKGVNLCCALAPDGKTLALAQPFGQVVYLLDAASGKEIRQFEVPKPGVSYLTIGPDSRTLVVVCYDGSVQTWDITSGAKRHQLPAWGNAWSPKGFGLVGHDTVALSPDGKWLARVQRNGSPVLMELATGQLAPLPETPAKGVNVFAFSPDSRTLAWVGSRDSTIHLLEVVSGQERRKFAGHRGAVESLAFARDGRLLISGSQDSTALVWELIGSAAADEKLDSCWTDLASEQADRAYQAMQKLLRAPKQAVAELGKHLRPIPEVDTAEVARLIAELDSEQFTVRQKARDTLAQLGERAEPSLREAAKGKPSLEARKRVEELLDSIKTGMLKPPSLRQVRAVEVLEQIGNREAQDVLKTLAKGMPTARLTREANVALERLAKR